LTDFEIILVANFEHYCANLIPEDAVIVITIDRYSIFNGGRKLYAVGLKGFSEEGNSVSN